MNRRTFLCRLAVASGLTLAAPVLASPHTALATGPDGARASVAHTAVDAVAYLAAAIGAPAWCPAAHLLRRFGSASLAGRAAAEQAASRGYAEVEAALVYRAVGDDAGAATLFFATSDAGGAHALAPFIYPIGNRHGATLLGGPALVGLAAHARAQAATYPHLSGAAIGRALLPAGDYGYHAPTFEADAEWKAFYPTREGAIGMTYLPERAPYYTADERLVAGTGTLALVVFDAAHEIREARTYHIAYREPRSR